MTAALSAMLWPPPPAIDLAGGGALAWLHHAAHACAAAHDHDDDAGDVADALAGDEEAYCRLVLRHQRDIAAQMRRFSRDPAVAEELVHEVFVEAYLSLRSYRATAPWLHWLRRIAVRLGYRHWAKRRARRPEVALSAEDWARLRGASPAPAEAADAADLVYALLAQLAPSDRLVLTLLYLDGCTMAEAAARAGWTVVGTKVRAFRARGRLKALLERGGT